MKLLPLCVALALAANSHACAAEFAFGNDLNGVTGQASAALVSDGVTLVIAAGPTGALFDERGDQGLGVNSLGVPGVVGGDRDKLELLSGDKSVAGTPEFLTLSFNKPGFITAIDFDGVKDEALEYFLLAIGASEPIAFFDSAANTSAPGAVDRAIDAGVLTGPVEFLREDGPLDDELDGLAIPFAAGQTLTITYAELGSAFNPLEPGNGARFEGITVSTIPEPSAVLIVVSLAAAVARSPRF